MRLLLVALLLDVGLLSFGGLFVSSRCMEGVLFF